MSRRSRPWLNQQGIRLAEVRIVPDDIERIGEAVNALRAGHDYLFTTGGIGPTHDDITVDAIAAAFGVPVIVHPEARAILEDYYRDRPGGLTEARLRMARVPEGAELIANPSSGAPGIKIGNVYILAGVPHIAASMLEALTGKLEGGRPMVSVTVGARAPESDVADLLRETEAAHPGRRDRQLSVLQGRPLRRQFRDPLGRRRAGAGDRRGAVRAAARGGLRAGRGRDLTFASLHRTPGRRSFLSWGPNGEALPQLFAQECTPSRALHPPGSRAKATTSWRDEDDIGGGTSFSSEIERALEDCDAVLVLWSAQFGAIGLGTGRSGLRPRRRQADPTLARRHRPSTRLWTSFNRSTFRNGKDKARRRTADRINTAIERISGLRASAPHQPSANASPQFPHFAWSLFRLSWYWRWSALALFLWSRSAADRGITIAVSASPTSSDRRMAVDYANVAAADMAAFLPRQFDRARIIGPADARWPDSGYRMSIATDAHGAGANATLTLSDHGRTFDPLVAELDRARALAADLKAQVSATASQGGTLPDGCTGRQRAALAAGARTVSERLHRPG